MWPFRLSYLEFYPSWNCIPRGDCIFCLRLTNSGFITYSDLRQKGLTIDSPISTNDISGVQISWLVDVPGRPEGSGSCTTGYTLDGVLILRPQRLTVLRHSCIIFIHNIHMFVSVQKSFSRRNEEFYHIILFESHYSKVSFWPFSAIVSFLQMQCNFVHSICCELKEGLAVVI